MDGWRQHRLFEMETGRFVLETSIRLQIQKKAIAIGNQVRPETGGIWKNNRGRSKSFLAETEHLPPECFRVCS